MAGVGRFESNTDQARFRRRGITDPLSHQHSIHALSGVPLKGRQDVPVCVQRQTDLAVAERFAE